MKTAEKIVRELKKRNDTVSCAESCTGGLVASELISVPGASDVLRSSYVTYSEEEKDRILSLDPSLIRTYGVVSLETAKAMAEGVLRISGADLGIGTTGVAGPGDDGPVPCGRVYIAASYGNHTKIRRFQFHGTRNFIRRQAAEEALKLALLVMEEDTGK